MSDMKGAIAPECRGDGTAGLLPALLIVGPVAEGHDTKVFDELEWQAQYARDCFEVAVYLRKNANCVVVCERDLCGDCCWKDVLQVADSVRNPPPVIVTSRHADDQLWSEVLNLGGFDVLAKPFNADEVRRVITFAWDHWFGNRFRAERQRSRPANAVSA